MFQNKKLFYVYIVLGFILNIFIFPIGGLNFLKNALTALTDLDSNVEVKKVVIESDGFSSEIPGNFQMTKSSEWTSTKNAKITFDVDTIASFSSVDLSFDVVLVVDVSTSMLGEKFDSLKASSKKYIDKILANQDNTIALIEYHNNAEVLSDFTKDGNLLTEKIDNLELKCAPEIVDGVEQDWGNCTNYYDALVKVGDVVSEYEFKDNRQLVVLFLTDGAANGPVSMIHPEYLDLKEKYPDMVINGIQYEMGSDITYYLKVASDYQYDAYVDDIYDKFFTTTYKGVLEKYDKFEIVDYINTDYFEVISEEDIEVSIGSVRIEWDGDKEKVIWSVEPDTLASGTGLHMEINTKLKDEYIETGEGYYPTNKGVEVTTKLPHGEETFFESDKTPVLKYGYKVYYEGNYPSECNKTYHNEETHYYHEIVEFEGSPEACVGYKFTGWKVINRVGDNSFKMMEQDVHIKGTWSKMEVSKSMDGTIAAKDKLYDVIKRQAVPDNIKSAYVTGENGIDFKSISSDTNGKGVYMMADTASDEYPIYYYRGDVDNNNVLFADICWKMVRTTDTGGIKLIFKGFPTEQDGKFVCTTDDSPSQVKYNQLGSLASVGYQYGKFYKGISAKPSSGVLFGTSASYDETNGIYTLTDTAKSLDDNHHYTCNNAEGTCDILRYYSSSSDYFELENGELLEEAIEKMLSNGIDSEMKDYLENDWYENNMKSFADYLEDTVWCNDRSISQGFEGSGWNPNGGKLDTSLEFDAKIRIRKGVPSLKCREQDSFTVENNQLKYPIALLSSDEVMYAGGHLSGESTFYLNFTTWLMTPHDDMLVMSLQSKYISSWAPYLLFGLFKLQVRPSVSLKSGVYYSTGIGTIEDPYVIDTN